MGEPPAGQGVRCFVVAGFWLREGVWDGLVEQFEGAALGGCGGGEDVGGGVGGQGDGVAGEGGEVVEQVVEGQGGEPVGGAAGVGVVGGLGCSGGFGDGVVALRWVFVGVGQGCPGAAQVPDEVAGQHAEQDVGADPCFGVVADGPQVQVDGLQ